MCPSSRWRARPRATASLEPAGLHAIAVIAAAPDPLRERILRVHEGAKGLTITMRQGPPLHFGTDERLRAKWAAAARVLSDPTSAGTTYLDLRVPERPAAGGLEQIAQAPPDTTTAVQPSTGG